MLQYIFMTSSYLLPPKPRISRSLLQTQGTSRVFWHFSYRYLRFWFIGQCHSFADMSRYIFTTSSYLFPPKPRFSRSLIQTQLRNLKGFLAFILHIFEVQVYLEMSFFCRQVTELFHHSFILVPSKTKVYKVTTSNTRNLKGILTFILQTYKVPVYWTMSFLRRISLYCFATSSYLLPLNQGFQGHYFKHKEPQGYSGIHLTDIFGSDLDSVIPSQT